MLKRLRNFISPPAVLARGTSGTPPLLHNDPPAVEQRATILAGKHVSYTLKRSSKRRSIGLRIDDRGLTASVPMRASEKWLHSVLQDKAGWVVEKLDGWQTRKPPETRWADGGTVNYLGNLLTLRVTSGLSTVVRQLDHELRVCVADEQDAKAIESAVTIWHQHEALKLFHVRVDHYAALLDVAPYTVKLSVAKKRWGSCTASGKVRLNVQLIKLPMRLIDYVVVHELAHLREMNHSPAFWEWVRSICPDYAKSRRELKSQAL